MRMIQMMQMARVKYSYWRSLPPFLSPCFFHPMVDSTFFCRPCTINNWFSSTLLLTSFCKVVCSCWCCCCCRPLCLDKTNHIINGSKRQQHTITITLYCLNFNWLNLKIMKLKYSQKKKTERETIVYNSIQ